MGMSGHHTGAVANEAHAVSVPAGTVTLQGDLVVPRDARGVVLFAHGSGSSRFSRRNRWVASELQSAGLATLLIDLLTESEAARDQLTGELRFDIDLLALRVVDAIDWIRHEPLVGSLPIGLFGASTGAAAALIAAARRPDAVGAVVSRGGRPDLAASALSLVQSPALLIIGARDPEVLTLNRHAYAQLECERALEIVPGASHLFEEPGALEVVADLSRTWFADHLSAKRSDS
jgi:pimeloyl-ACP methyl ester carboxylesterase